MSSFMEGARTGCFGFGIMNILVGEVLCVQWCLGCCRVLTRIAGPAC